MAKSGMQTLDSLEEEFEYSKLAFELIKDEPKDKDFQNNEWLYRR